MDKKKILSALIRLWKYFTRYFNLLHLWLTTIQYIRRVLLSDIWGIEDEENYNNVTYMRPSQSTIILQVSILIKSFNVINDSRVCDITTKNPRARRVAGSIPA